ncbi:hypothetical protein B7494_g7020 [Chlorociboria aeruginascens]|nr:hypothetical protein B7494_g7020 [Chlorociboria aeruginascens]
MHTIGQRCRPKHQVLILKCYPRTTKGAVDVKPNSSELSYLLYYATTRRSKVQKVGAYLEKKTRSDVRHAKIGNVQVTLQILEALIEKAPRDLPLYAPYVLRILDIILRSHDITMVESSIPTFEAFCEHHDIASLAVDQEYLQQYENIVYIYASLASTRPLPAKIPLSAPIAIRWRSVGLRAIKSVASSDALASVVGQLDIIVPILLENLWTDHEDFLDLVEHKALIEEKIDAAKLLKRRTSVTTVGTVDTSGEANAAALSRTTADADKLAEEEIGVLATQCLKQIFVVNNRSQVHSATKATLKFIADRVSQREDVVGANPTEEIENWATRIFAMIARWTPVQDRYAILVATMETLVSCPMLEENFAQQLVLATMVDSLLKSDINLIGLSVMDVLLGLIQQVLRILQLSGVPLHSQQSNVNSGPGDISDSQFPTASTGLTAAEAVSTPTSLRRDLLSKLQECIGDLATHVYYADQISDMVSAILLRLKPSPLSGVPNAVAAIENPNITTNVISSSGELTEDPTTDGFFSFDTAKVKALEAIKSILLVASRNVAGGSLGRSRVSVRVWEGTQWLLRDSDGRVRKAYVDALLTWLDREMTKSDLQAFEDKPKSVTHSNRDESATNLSKRAVSSAAPREKANRPSKTTFLQLLHLAIYENALQYVDNETDIALLHLLLSQLVLKLGVNSVKNGLPMIFRLQEDILEAETPLAKVRMGSLCHGYFWHLSQTFDFESSPIGREIQSEILRRQRKRFWVDQICLPPIPLDQIGTPGQSDPQQGLPLEELESESLNPFDGRFQMVKLISLSYAESLSSPPISPPASPSRSFSQPPLSSGFAVSESGHTMPEKIKEQMMSEWSREAIITLVQASSKTVSLSGSRAGTNTTGNRNFLSVNGNTNNGGTNSGTQSPQGQVHHVHRSRPNSNYGLVGGLGALQKLRKGSGQSPSPVSESSRNSVTRVDQLKRVLSGQQGVLPGPLGVAHSDASSESMVSYDFTASEVSFNTGLQNASPTVERAPSLREPNERARSKSRDRAISSHENTKALSSHPANLESTVLDEKEEDLDEVPPVPPLPSSFAGEATVVQDHVDTDISLMDRKQSSKKGYQSNSWTHGPVVDLESLLNGIETDGADQGGNVAKPPY